MTALDPRGPASTTEAAAAVPANRYPDFDGLRAIAATSVVVTHVSGISGANSLPLVGHLLARTDIGVTIFFVISGFLIYRPFTAAAQHGRPVPNAPRFWLRRALRIYPLYWLVLTVVAFGLGSMEDPSFERVLLHYSLTMTYSGAAQFDLLVQTWTLAAEIAFYLCLPTWAFLVRSAARGRHVVAVELAGIALLFLVGNGIRAWLLWNRDGGPGLSWLPANVQLFALGMLLAVASTQTAGAARRAGEWAGRHAALCWFGAATSYWVVSQLIGLPVGLLQAPSHGSEMARGALYGLTAILLVAPAVFGVDRPSLIRRFLRLRWLALVGLVSYGLYLWHLDVIGQLYEREVFEAFERDQFLAALGAVLAIALALAAVTYVAVERPTLRAKDRAR